MIEQYLCAYLDATAAQSGDKASQPGFNCVGKTFGITEDEATRLEAFAKYFFSKPFSAGRFVIAKYTVGKTGNFAIGLFRPDDRGDIAHQYLFNGDSRADLVSSPDEMFRLPFITSYDRNEKYDLSSSDSVELTSALPSIMSFADVTRAFGVDDKMFVQIISAVFDCRKNNRKIIFVSDNTFEKNFAAVCSFLYYIFRFLPYHIRMHLGFDTAFSHLTNRNQINISFALPSQLKIADDGTCTVGERECRNDYIVYNGRILHNASDGDNDVSGNYLIPGIAEYITQEYRGIDCSAKLTALFENLYMQTTGIPVGYLNDILTYDAVFAGMELLSESPVERSDVEPLIRFYLASRKRIARNELFWDDSIKYFLKAFDDAPTDNWMMSVLSALYCQGGAISAEVGSRLKARAVKLFAQDKKSALEKFHELVANYDPESLFGLASELFGADDEIARMYVDYRIGMCKTAYEVCSEVQDLCHVLDDGVYADISAKAVDALDSLTITGSDIDSIRKLSLSESVMDIRTVINGVAEHAMDKADYRNMTPSWFRQQNWSFDYLPESFGGVTVFLIRDMLNESVTTLPGQFYSNYAYVDKDVFSKAAETASKAIIRMFLSDMLQLSVSTYAALNAAVYHAGEYDYEALSSVLAHYPAEMHSYTAYFGSITSAEPIEDKFKTLRFAKYLKSIEEAAVKNIRRVNACELIASVNRSVKSGIKNKYAKTFNSHIYSAFLASSKGVTKAFYAATKPLHTHSSRSIKNREIVAVSSICICAVALVLIASILIFGGVGKPHQNAGAEIFFGETMLAANKYEAGSEDMLLISGTDKTVFCAELTGEFSVKPSKDVTTVSLRQLYMYSPADTSLTAKSPTVITPDENGRYVFALDTSGAYIYRVILEVTVTTEDGTSAVFATAIENNNYRGTDE